MVTPTAGVTAVMIYFSYTNIQWQVKYMQEISPQYYLSSTEHKNQLLKK